MTVISHPAFNELFPVRTDQDGTQEMKPLREMTADEVRGAVFLLHYETTQLAIAAEDAAEIVQKIESGTDQDVSLDQSKAAASALRASAEADFREARLLSLIYMSMPEWRSHKGMALVDALRRWWPNGADDMEMFFV